MRGKKNIIMAICYDFDGTLAPGNIHEHTFIPDQLGMKNKIFWEKVKANACNNNMDEILSYLEFTLEKAKAKKNVKFTKDTHGVAKFPAVAINYTSKTQYLFRINKHNDKEEKKDFLNNWNNDVNEYTPDEDRRIPFSRMIYIGDGKTDVPAMKMTNYQGGYSIGVYGPKTRNFKKNCKELLKNERCSFIAPANYEKNADLDRIVKFIIDKIHIENEMVNINNKYKS